jgi:RNA polymerase sigma factor (sigma-70 family)
VPPSVAHNEWTSETSARGPLRLPRLGDERLARLATRGSTRAFAAVYERYHQTLYRYCRSIVRDDADAQDALQSTFTRALSALQRGQLSAPLRPWLFRIAHNEAISVLRRRRGEESLAVAALPVVPSAEERAGERARIAVLLGDLAALPDRARSALVMRELSGLSHEDIAIALDTTPGAAKQAIFEARRGLQEFAAGRAMPCAEVCRAISDGDRRVIRGRRVRAHLRDCASCARFATSIAARESDLRALVPVLPAAASAAVLTHATHTAARHGVAGSPMGTGAAGAAGKTVGLAFTSKGFASASLLATAAVSVGGVAAVVRLAPESGPLGKPRSGQSARVSTAHHHHGAGAHAGSGAVTSSRESGSSAAAVRSGGQTGAASRHVRFTARHGHGRAAGWHRATFGGHRKSSYSGLTHGQSAHGQSSQRDPAHVEHGHGDGGLHRGEPAAGRGAVPGAVRGAVHGTLEGYTSGGHGHHADPASGSAPGAGRHGHNK